jgi:hypothetical protein
MITIGYKLINPGLGQGLGQGFRNSDFEFLTENLGFSVKYYIGG